MDPDFFAPAFRLDVDGLDGGHVGVIDSLTMVGMVIADADGPHLICALNLRHHGLAFTPRKHRSNCPRAELDGPASVSDVHQNCRFTEIRTESSPLTPPFL